jgi:hypothetical protein
MRRRGRIAIIGGSVGLALILGFPYTCGEPDCPVDFAGYCGPTCGNHLGMYFRGRFVPLFPVVVTIAIGVAVGWLLVLAISKLRSLDG